MHIGKGSAVAAAIVSATFGPATHALGADTPSAAFEPGLHTYYTPNADGSALNWTTCGKSGASVGCYDFGTISPLSGACAILEGTPVVSGRVSQEPLYILEANRNNFPHAVLNVYLKTDTAGAFGSRTAIVFQKTIDLGQPAPKNPSCYMATNGRFIYAATNASTTAAQVNKKTYAVTQVGGFSPPATVHSITADEKGNVSINFGSSTGSNSGFYLFHPQDSDVEDGADYAILPNTTQGVSLK
jgi:hypothetical protein